VEETRKWVVAGLSCAALAVGCASDDAQVTFTVGDASSDRVTHPDARGSGEAGAPKAPPSHRDAEVSEASLRDVSVDGAPPDAHVPDASVPGNPLTDAAVQDARKPDAGSPDEPPPDAGDRDGSLPDGAPRSSIPATALVGSTPADGATGVPRTAWVRLTFADGLRPLAANSVTLDCGTGTPLYDVLPFEKTTIVVNPRAPLASDATCTVTWLAPGGFQSIHFTVAPLGAPAILPYDRNDKTALEPFPDDFYLVADGSTRTGKRVDVRVPQVDVDLGALFDSILTPMRALDGMSPLAPLVVALPAALDPTSVPRTAAESLDPFATLGLFDIDTASSEHGQRVPFDAILRDETDWSGQPAHVLVVFPGKPLRPRGKYAFVVTNRALVTPSRPLEASSFFRTVASGTPVTADEQRLAPVLHAVLSELEGTSPKLNADDLALALGISIRSVDDIPRDLLAVRETVQAAAPPAFSIVSATPDNTPGTSIAAIVHGTWSPPDWSTGTFIGRDTSGRPAPVGTATLDFTLALPKSAISTQAPLIMYQHGQPGNAETEVPIAAARGLAAAGFAVIGFTDVANREIIPTGDISVLNAQALVTLATEHDLPDYLSLLTHADQLAFLRMIPTLGSVDVLPLGAPDGIPDLDPGAPLGYLGTSQGSIHGMGLLAFAPEIHAAALVTGGGRFGATLVHQSWDALYEGIRNAGFSTLTRAEFYAGISLVQSDYDRQDPQNLARHLFREPLSLGTAARASVLMTEGLGDTEVPFYSTRSGASMLGLPQMRPHAEDVVFLPTVAPPVQANIDTGTTGALFQYVPKAYVGVAATPGCVVLGQTEGHFCAQVAAEAVKQRVTFFESALVGVPRIVDPFN
jgi:hypothetical protein